jgi:DNA-binding NtrC family response regulator
MEKILIIDDDEAIRETLYLFFTNQNYKVHLASDGYSGLEIIEKISPDLVVTDLMMNGLNGIEVLKRAKEMDPNTQVLLVTAFDDLKSTINAIQEGAYDYVEKPIDLERFSVTVKRALQSKKLSERLDTAISESKEEYRDENSLVGKTSLMREIFKKIGKVSSNRVTVLIQGESGTGKELITKIIHYSGITKNEPFVAVNCTALSETLLESELFGHVKGSFTGAIRDKKGKFELAEEGTIFLDEISEISNNLQVKLLRVLQEREFEKVGGEHIIPLKARVVTATNKNLSELVEQGKFREDLYYRLKVFSIDVPPLRERKDDIPNLVTYLLKKINRDLHKNVRKIPFEVMEMLQNHEWIGNVRELENTLMQAIVLAKGDVLEKENILLRKTNGHMATNNLHLMSIAEIEKNHIKFILDYVSWDKKKACEILGISKPTLYSKIQLYNIVK